MTKQFEKYVRLYLKITKTDTVDASTECVLAIQYVSSIMSTEHCVLYGNLREFHPTIGEITSTIRECCGEDVYSRMFEGKENEQ